MTGTARDREYWEELLVQGYQPTAQDFADLVQSFLLADASDFPDPLPEVSGKFLLDVATSGGGGGGVSSEELGTALNALDAAKADKVENAAEGNVAALDATGNLVDGGGRPYLVSAFFPGQIPVSQLVSLHVFSYSVSFAENLSGSSARCTAPPAAQKDFDLQKNGTSVGTIQFAAGATTATFVAPAVMFAAGDVLAIRALGAFDAALTDLSCTLQGAR